MALAAHAARHARRGAALGELLDHDRLIGHSYLMHDDLAEIGYDTVWTEELEPVLREHLFSQPEEMKRLKAIFQKS